MSATQESRRRSSGTASEIAAVRRFSRFYTQTIGVLEEAVLASPFTLPEARVLYELAHRDACAAGELGVALNLDAGYVSRLVGGLERRSLIDKVPCPRDGRRVLLSLSEEGNAAFAGIDAASRRQIEGLLAPLASDERARLMRAMASIEELLGSLDARRAPYVLRPPQPGDLGWVVHRHGATYAREYGWTEEFEGLVAGIVAHFVEHFDPRRERCWIAEVEDEPVGSVFLVRHPEQEGTAKLRLLLVEPRARGAGIGRRLVSECTRFARQAGYRRITLWTQSVLIAARRLYREEGYRLVGEEPTRAFGAELVSETWELDL